MSFAQIANGGIRKGSTETAEQNGAIVMIFRGELGSLAILRFGARCLSGDELFDGLDNISIRLTVAA